jgi:hypothetical protein
MIRERKAKRKMKRTFDFSNMPTVGIVEQYKEEKPRCGAGPGGRAGPPPTINGNIETKIEAPPMKVSWIPEQVPVTKENLLSALNVTEQEREMIWSFDQRDPLWHLHRAGRLTGSRMGSACGVNKWCTPDQLVQEWLYKPVVMNAAMLHGIEHEAPVREMYLESRRRQNTKGLNSNGLLPVVEFEPPPSGVPEDFQHIEMDPPIGEVTANEPYELSVRVRGLVVDHRYSWLGYSSDGELSGTEGKHLLEIKCPRNPYPEIPLYYYAQIQEGMWLLGLPFCDFVVWTKTSFTIRRFAFNEDYWNHYLFPRAEDFYMNKFLDAAVVAIENERAYNPLTAKRTKTLLL